MRERLANLRAQLRWLAEEYKLGHLLGLLLFLVCIWFAAAVCIWLAERSPGRVPALRQGDHFYTLSDCFWCSTVYLVSGLEEFEPSTTPAKAAAVVVMVIGVGVLGLIGARLLATLVERTRLASQVRRKPGCTLRGHVVICDWSDKGDAIVREIHASQFARRRGVVIVAPNAQDVQITERRAYRGVWAVSGDPLRDEVLRQADVGTAHSAVILIQQDTAQERPDAADARAILISLALHAVCPGLHVCVETLTARGGMHLAALPGRELINVRDVAAKLIAHAAQKHGLSEFFLHLLTVSSNTNETYVVPVPAGLVGRSFSDAQQALGERRSQNLELVGVRVPGTSETAPAQMVINPRREPARSPASDPETSERPLASTQVEQTRREVWRDAPLQAGDELVVIARREPDLASVQMPVRSAEKS